MTGGWRDGDESYEWLTARRPVLEAVFAAQAETAKGVEVRRGTAVTGLLTGASAIPGVPHVAGVRTKAGEAIPAELVVDMSGRRSALPDWLAAIGARRPPQELEDCGCVYYGRHFESADGSVPPLLGPPQIHWGTITSLTLPADNGTWSVGLVTSSKDTALRPLREIDRWQTVVRGLPLVAHWLDGSPIDEGVRVIARLEDRYRGFVVDGMPVATGVVAVADSWACSNPANGRGASIGMLHALTLRDRLRLVGLDAPAAFPPRSTQPPRKLSSRGTAPRSPPTGTVSPRSRRVSTVTPMTLPTRSTSWNKPSRLPCRKTQSAFEPSWTPRWSCGRQKMSSPGPGCATRPSSLDPAGASSGR